jgi:hypothetical protein
MAARAFEAYIQDNPIKNHFLAAGTKQSNEAKIGAYPLLSERIVIAKAMQNYFFQLGFAVSKQLHKGRTEH